MRALLVFILLCSGALAADMTPFFRMAQPNILTAGPTARQYTIIQPKGATSYRFVNPCAVDVRISTVPTMTDTVSETTGIRYLARTVEVIASSQAMSKPRVVSIMTMGDPGPAGCKPELTYGTGQ